MILYQVKITLVNCDGFHTNSRTNSAQYHIWSPFLMVCVVIAITISIFNIIPILNIQLHSRKYCECNCPFFEFSCVWYSYVKQDFVNICKGFEQNPTSNFIAQKSKFFEPLSAENLRNNIDGEASSSQYPFFLA